ncbi:MAG: S1 RNA-binding domain-containing protein, partial [Okeania sp. SIO2H7]|nr:S1 RNA-binding domain-containing protein [Okeania sp. SIO2H7]
MVSKSTSSKAANESFTMDDFAQALDEYNYDFSKGQVVSGKIHSHESEGAYVEIGAKSLAFVPLQEAFVGEIGELSEALPLEEQRDFLIIREQDRDGQVLISVRQLEIKKIWEKLSEREKQGQSFPVRVTGINKGGVTVDIESMRGFVPRSHLLQKENLESLVGELLTVNFLELDSDRNKIVLSQRLASQSAGFSELEIGQLVEGKISSIKPFGVFVDLDNN